MSHKNRTIHWWQWLIGSQSQIEYHPAYGTNRFGILKPRTNLTNIGKSFFWSIKVSKCPPFIMVQHFDLYFHNYFHLFALIIKKIAFFFGCKFLYTALFKKYRYIHLSTCCNADEPYSFMIILYSANKNNVMAFHQISQKQQSDRQWLSESETCHISKWHALSSSSTDTLG